MALERGVGVEVILARSFDLVAAIENFEPPFLSELTFILNSLMAREYNCSLLPSLSRREPAR